MLITDKESLNGEIVQTPEHSLEELRLCFELMKTNYLKAKNDTCGMYMDEYGDEQGITLFNERYPEPININTLPNQAKIIANKYKICGITKLNNTNEHGFIFKVENVRLRVRTYCSMGDYYVHVVRYQLSKLRIRIYQAMPNRKGQLIYGTSNYPHPHIAGSVPCFGSFESEIKVASGHFNMVGVVNQIKMYLNSYYGRSVYNRIADYRPYKIVVGPIDVLKHLPNRYADKVDIQWRDKQATEGKLSDKENKIWKGAYKKLKYLEVKPQDGEFYRRIEDASRRETPHNISLASKTAMIAEKYDKDFYQSWSMFTYHVKKCNSNNVVKLKSAEYKDKYAAMNVDLNVRSDAWYKIGWRNGVRIEVDDLDNRHILIAKLLLIKDRLEPSKSNGFQMFEMLSLSAFYTYLKSYDTFESLEKPINNEKDVLESVHADIDELWPLYTQHADAFKRKIINKLDKERRRLINGLNHTQSDTESNQLSFESLS